MSGRILIELENISKRFWLYTRYRDRLKQIFVAPLTHRDYAHSFWALHGVSLKVHQGETVGVIGINGSGKSTLLQIIAGTLKPTQGKVNVQGRLTALLELGAGFHTEFTGRENVYLSGATLGISQSEMKRRFDQIIDFADIGEFIDQPVKLYSSGMYIRLAFAIATSVDPEILVVDEALAVGDFGFVIKCMHRMQQLKNQGAAIILVTHDVQTVRSFCDTALWLARGVPQVVGSPLDVTSQYIQNLWNQKPDQDSNQLQPEPRTNTAQAEIQRSDSTLIRLQDRPGLIRWGTGNIRITGYRMGSGDSMEARVFEHGHRMTITVQIQADCDVSSDQIGVGIGIRNNRGLDIINPTTYDAGNRLPPLRRGQVVTVTFEFDNIFAPGDYALVINVEDRLSNPPSYYDYIENAALIKVVSRIPIFSVVLPPIRQTILLDEKIVFQEQE